MNAAGTISQMWRGALERGDHFLRRPRPLHPLGLHGCHRSFVDVVGHAVVAACLESSDHVGAHAPQSDHGDLHGAQVATNFPDYPHSDD